MTRDKEATYSADETKARVKAAVQGAFSAPPKPPKSMGPKGMPSQSKKKRKKAKAAA